MINKVCLCGRVAHRRKWGSYVCLKCDEIEKKNTRIFPELFGPTAARKIKDEKEIELTDGESFA